MKRRRFDRLGMNDHKGTVAMSKTFKVRRGGFSRSVSASSLYRVGAWSAIIHHTRIYRGCASRINNTSPWFVASATKTTIISTQGQRR